MTTFYFNRKKYDFGKAIVNSLEDLRSSIAAAFDPSVSYELICDDYSSRYLAAEDSFQYVVMCRVLSASGAACSEFLVGCCDEYLS